MSISPAAPEVSIASQLSIQRNVLDDVASAGPKPCDLTERGALEELLKTQDFYSLEPQNLATYEYEKLRVAKGDVVPKAAHTLVSGHLRDCLLDPELFIIRSAADVVELERTCGAIRPYWDPILRGNASERSRLFWRLHELGILSFRRRPRAFAGLFFVKKKDGAIRLIVDARQANRYHKRPPKTCLGSGGAMVGLDLSDECLLETAGAGCVSEVEICGSPGDVIDGFFHFKNESVADFFALEFQVRAGDYGVASVYNPDTGNHESVGVDETLWPVVEAMPMGWSWALHICHSAVEEALVAVHPCGSDGLVVERKPAPKLSLEVPFVSSYVHTDQVIGLSRASVGLLHGKVTTELERRGFTLHAVSGADPDHQTLCVVLDGRRRVLSHQPRRLWRVFLALQWLLRVRRFSPEVLRCVVGHLAFIFCLNRPLLSALDECYKQQSGVLKVWRKMPLPLVTELRTISGLVWLARAHFGLAGQSHGAL